MLVHHFLENSASRLPHKIALICGEDRLTYEEVNTLADSLALGLGELGVERQDRVVIFLDNSVESVISIFGILKARGIFIVLNPTMKPKKLNYILRDSGARVLVTHKNKARIIRESLTDLPDLRDIIWVGGLPDMGGRNITRVGHHLWNDILSPLTFNLSRLNSNVQPNALRLGPSAPIIDIDLATIIYTSGSTGDPKGVMSAHYNVVAAATSITQYLENVEDDIIIDCLPLSFDYGLYQVIMAFLFGGTVILEKSFVYPAKVLQKIAEEGVTGFPIVPTMVAILLQMEDLKKFDLSSLRYISNTAAALPVPHIRKMQELFPHVRIYSMYGLTECKRVSYLPPEELSRKPESVGIAMPNSEVFIVDENGNKVGPGVIGELVVRGSNVMQGYWNAPEETARTFRPGRYPAERLLYTGDYFKMDSDGFLYFVARKDDLIKTKGERISPKEIENALCELDQVAEAAVVGIPDEIAGQAIKAYIVLKKGAKLTQEDIRKYCAANLEPFMVPKYIEFKNEFPKSPSGKIDKKQL